MEQKQLFFIRGHERSGTNWLCNLVNLHPDIFCTGEFRFENLFAGFHQTLDMPFGMLQRRSDEFSKEFYDFVERLIYKWCGNAPVFGDRSPVGILETYIPQKKYLLITRDGRDVLVSKFYHYIRVGFFDNHPPMLEKRKKFEANPNYFEEHKHELLQDEIFVRAWAEKWSQQILSDVGAWEKAQQKELDIDCYWVKYEELCTTTDTIRNEMYEFLGVNPFKAEPLNDLTSAGFETTNTESHYRKGKSGAWKEYFTAEQLNWFYEEADEAMRLL